MFILTLIAALLNFLLNPGFTFTPLLVTEHFHKGAVELSIVESAFSLGMVVGGLVLSTWGGFRRRIVTTLTGIIGIAVSTAVIALAKSDAFFLAVIGMALTAL
jgi:DHA3 family macrolide efflux protein-like MFS transporter